jgi:peptide/nickel transport system permease protein
VQRYIVRRLLYGLVVLWGVSIITFTLSFVLPGDPARAIAGPRATGPVLDKLRAEWGLDKPIPVQYVTYLSKVLRGDMGRSYFTKMEVSQAIAQRLPMTVHLLIAGLLAELMIGLPVGILSALKQYSLWDRLGMIWSLIGISLPPYVVGLALLYAFAFKVPIFALGGSEGVTAVVLPALTIGLAGGAWYARVMRSSMLDIITADYIRTAHAKGLPEWAVVLRHALRNAMRPIVMMMAGDIGFFFGGVLVVERVFGWPGIGFQAWTAIEFRDVPMIMGTVLIGAVFVVLANTMADIMRAVIDPQVRLS